MDKNRLEFGGFNEEDENLHVIWHNYAKDMAKRRPDSVLEEGRFISYITNGETCFYRFGNSFVFGQMDCSFFIPTHFASAGLREGITLIKELKKLQNIVFVVTPDLGKMLKRLGFKMVPVLLSKKFRGQKHLKVVFVSDMSFFNQEIKSRIFSSILDLANKIKVFFHTEKTIRIENEDSLFADF